MFWSFKDMNNNNSKKNAERKPPEIHIVKDGESEKSHEKTNAQLAAEAMARLARGEASTLDIIILQRYFLKKPRSCG